MYKKASQGKLRFASPKGLLSTEDLWDLSLTALDTLAKGVNKELKNSEEESFIAVKSSANTELSLKLEILKDVIATRLEQNEAKNQRLAKATEIQKLEELLGRKQDEALLNLTAGEIQAKLNALKG